MRKQGMGKRNGRDANGCIPFQEGMRRGRKGRLGRIHQINSLDPSGEAERRKGRQADKSEVDRKFKRSRSSRIPPFSDPWPCRRCQWWRHQAWAARLASWCLAKQHHPPPVADRGTWRGPTWPGLTWRLHRQAWGWQAWQVQTTTSWRSHRSLERAAWQRQWQPPRLQQHRRRV